MFKIKEIQKSADGKLRTFVTKSGKKGAFVTLSGGLLMTSTGIGEATAGYCVWADPKDIQALIDAKATIEGSENFHIVSVYYEHPIHGEFRRREALHNDIAYDARTGDFSDITTDEVLADDDKRIAHIVQFREYLLTRTSVEATTASV